MIAECPQLMLEVSKGDFLDNQGVPLFILGQYVFFAPNINLDEEPRSVREVGTTTSDGPGGGGGSGSGALFTDPGMDLGAGLSCFDDRLFIGEFRSVDLPVVTSLGDILSGFQKISTRRRSNEAEIIDDGEDTQSNDTGGVDREYLVLFHSGIGKDPSLSLKKEETLVTA